MDFQTSNLYPIFENVDALVQSVAVDAVNESRSKSTLAKTGLGFKKISLQNFRSTKLGLLQKAIQTTDVKKRLQDNYRKITADKALKFLEKMIKQSQQQVLDVNQQSARTRQRIGMILEDLDQSADIQAGGAVSAVDTGLTAKSLVSNVYDQQRQSQTLMANQYQQIDQSCQDTQQNIVNQQETMDKAGLFGKFFQVFYQTAMTAASVFSTSLGPVAMKAIQGAVDVIMTSIGTSVRNKFNSEFQDQQQYLQNQTSFQNNMQHQVQQQLQDHQNQMNRDQNVIMTLESVR